MRNKFATTGNYYDCMVNEAVDTTNRQTNQTAPTTHSVPKDEEREMLLSPCFALNTTTTKELWIEQALEAYPCAGLKKIAVKATPTHHEVKKLRELQGFSFIGCLQSIFAAQPTQAVHA